MIKRELKMLVIGDKVQYTGKGDNQGYTGNVDRIYSDGMLSVTDEHGWWCCQSYKFFKFLGHGEE